MSRRVRWVLIAAALVIGVSVAINLLLTTGAPKSASPSSLATYTDRAFGFAVTYDPRLISAPGASQGSSSEMGGAAFTDRDPRDFPYPASIGDPSASPGTPQGGLTVFVQKMYGPARSSRADATQYLNGSGGPWGGRACPGFHADGVRPVTFNGVSGYEGAYHWNRGRNVSYFLTKGDYFYFLSLTYANAARPANKTALLAALRSFRVVSHPTIGSATTVSVTGYSSKRYDLQALAFPDAGHAWATADVWGRDQQGDTGVMGGAILAATSGDATWRRQESPSAWSSPSEIAFANDRCGWVLGSESVHHPLFATTDGGATWETQDAGTFGTDVDLDDIACADATHAWIVGDADSNDGVIVATTDGGVTWKKQALTTNGRLLAAAFADTRHGWAVGVGVILATSDGGRTWMRQLSGAQYGLECVACAGPSRAWAMGVGAENGDVLLATTDGGATWKVQYATRAGQWRSMAFADASHGWIVGDDGLILATSDGGRTWTRQHSGSTMDLIDVAFADRTHGLAMANHTKMTDNPGGQFISNTVLRTTNGGATWTK